VGRSEALRYLVDIGIKSSKPHKGRKAFQTSQLPTLPDELEGVEAVHATDGFNDEEIYWSVFCSRPKTDKLPLSLLNGFICQDDREFTNSPPGAACRSE
jgi:hypothetical protein